MFYIISKIIVPHTLETNNMIMAFRANFYFITIFGFKIFFF